MFFGLSERASGCQVRVGCHFVTICACSICGARINLPRLQSRLAGQCQHAKHSHQIAYRHQDHIHYDITSTHTARSIPQASPYCCVRVCVLTTAGCTRATFTFPLICTVHNTYTHLHTYQEHCVYSHYQGQQVCFHWMISLVWRGCQRDP